MKVLMHALAASCEELRARTGNPPLEYSCHGYIHTHTGISGETPEVYDIIKTHIISHPSECFKMAANISAAQEKYSIYKNNNISYKIILKINTSLNNLQVWILMHCSHTEYFQRCNSIL
jgi:Tfp pilus assembly ATPase PilU